MVKHKHIEIIYVISTVLLKRRPVLVDATVSVSAKVWVRRDSNGSTDDSCQQQWMQAQNCG